MNFKKITTINLIVFNERYYDESLIYTQNILPLIKLKNTDSNIGVRVYSFISIVSLVFERKKIVKFRQKLQDDSIKVVNLPTLFYPARFLILRWFIYPFFILNVLPYMVFFNLRDFFSKNKNVYNTRSYPASLAFLKFYSKKKNLVFDPRTDWITENLNLGVFSPDDLSVRLWGRWEKAILQEFGKSLFISKIFKDDVLKRNDLSDNKKFVIHYNLIDYQNFTVNQGIIKKDFLYTGSLGHWNNIRLYLDFFLEVYNNFPGAILKIVTNTKIDKLFPEIEHPKYATIRSLIKIEHNIPASQLRYHYESCAYGLQLMSKKDSRVGVKFIEYVASGICPVVNENVMGAAELSEKYKMGVVIKNDFHRKEQYINLIKNAMKVDRNSTDYIRFQRETDVNLIAEKLRMIYLFD